MMRLIIQIKAVAIGFALTVIALLTVGVLLFFMGYRIEQADVWARHSSNVMDAHRNLQQIYETTDLTGSLATVRVNGELESLPSMRKDVERQIQVLKQLVSDNAEQTFNAQTIEEAIHSRFQIQDEMIEFRKNNTSAMPVQQSLNSVRSREAIKDAFVNFRMVEQNLQNQRYENLMGYVKFRGRLTTTAWFLTVIAVSVFFVLTYKELKSKLKVTGQLEEIRNGAIESGEDKTAQQELKEVWKVIDEWKADDADAVST